MLDRLHTDIKKLASPEKAKIYQRFFKTGKGEYGEGDVFLGITVPQSRNLAKKYQNISFSDITKLLHSKYHEERLIALLILVHNFTLSFHSQGGRLKQRGSHDSLGVQKRKQIFDFYLANTKYINNWDLVDLSAHKIVGAYHWHENKPLGLATIQLPTLNSLARSKNLWERRIAMISTFYFIGKGEFDLALHIAEMLVHDKHDLIHKAVGWMLREIGKRDQEIEEIFLRKHYKNMPRTMLRYAIEKFSAQKRAFYLTS